MRKILLIVLALVSYFNLSAQSLLDIKDAKKAILMVHFGTTYDETRALTIDAINAKAEAAFSDFDVFEAYTSRIVIKNLGKRGIDKLTPRQALIKLAADGYTHVVVQGTNVIDGIEAEVLRKEAEAMSPFFKEIRVGRPLLYSIEDCQKVVETLAARYAEYAGKNSAVVLIGHGTSTPANAIYSQIDYMFSSIGKSNFHVTTLEGYPTYETTVARLKAAKAKNVTLVPFLFVAGDHARNDIAVEWCESLQQDGYSVKAIIEGLGQTPEIQDIYIDHVRAAINAPQLDAAGQKNQFIKENL